MSGIEKRKDARIPVMLGARVRKGPRWFLGTVLNLSVSGMFVKVPTLFDDGDELEIAFRLPLRDSQVEVLARVVWKTRIGAVERPVFGIGVLFLEMPILQKEALNFFVYRSIKSCA